MNLLFLTFLAPLLGFLILAFARGRISENAAAVVGVQVGAGNVEDDRSVHRWGPGGREDRAQKV